MLYLTPFTRIHALYSRLLARSGHSAGYPKLQVLTCNLQVPLQAFAGAGLGRILQDFAGCRISLFAGRNTVFVKMYRIS
jgi:hypothetical protein